MPSNTDWMQNPFQQPSSMMNPDSILSTEVGLDTNAVGTAAIGDQTSSWTDMSSIFGGKDASGMQQSGWLSPAIGTATSVANTWMGFQNMNTAKDQLKFQKNAWQEQFDIQKQEYDYTRQRRQERMDNYDASRKNL